MQEDKLIQLIGINKDYGNKDNISHVLKDVNLTIKIGEFVSVMGPSGSGKTTLMNIIGLLDQPSSGKYLMDYQDTYKLSDNTLSNIRKSKIGFVFQDYNLLTRYNVFENVALPMRYSPLSKKVRNNRVKEVLGMVGLSDHIYDKVTHLSGGQAQRVAIARALVNNPDIILADEPTGNLDSRSATEVLRLMRDLNQLGVTIVLVTHNPDIARVTSRVISIVDGSVKGDINLDKEKSESKVKSKKQQPSGEVPKRGKSGVIHVAKKDIIAADTGIDSDNGILKNKTNTRTKLVSGKSRNSNKEKHIPTSKSISKKRSLPRASAAAKAGGKKIKIFRG